MAERKRYPGIHNDRWGGMTDMGKIIRDAWLFDILPEDETCENWDRGQIDNLYDKVYAAWQPYGHLVSNLPDDLRQRHARIYGEAMERAREKGWDPSVEHENDD